MIIRIRFALLFLTATGCANEPPTVTLSAATPTGTTVPLAVAVSYKGDPGQLGYAWDIKAPCTATPSSLDSSSTIVTLGDDCPGKPLVATVRVSYPGGSVERTSTMTIQRPEGMPLPPVEPQITITSPTEGALTPGEFEVSGTAVPVEAAQRRHYWVVINPKGTGNYWPQGGAIVPSPPSGNWTVNATLGGVNNTKEVFHVAVVRADDSAHSSFTTYVEEGAKKKHNYPGRPLPAGATIVASVAVPKK